MGQTIAILGGDGIWSGHEVATNTGWSNLSDYADMNALDELGHLSDSGWSDDIATLTTELQTVVDNAPPLTKHIASEILALIIDSPVEVVALTDGTEIADSSHGAEAK